MNDANMGNKLEPGLGDRTHTVVKAVISAIAYVGDPAAEIFPAVIVPPVSKRRDRCYRRWVPDTAPALSVDGSTERQRLC